jgi:hypothetical protein
VRRPLEPFGFAVVGLATALLTARAGADLGALGGLVAAASAMVMVGGWLEERLGLGGGAFTWHRLALGQVALVLYFYLRSLLAHGLGLPGVGSVELWLVVAAVAVHRLRRREAGPPLRAAVVWALWWLSAIAFLSLPSGLLGPPSSDPDLHVFLAKLTATHGTLVYDQLPWDPAPLSYPSGFSVLNALWILLSGASPVAVVDCQVALQACLAVGLVVEVPFALRSRVTVGIAVLLIAAAHYVFSFPVNADFPGLEGTARLAHKAMLVLPLTFAFRLGASDLPRWRRLWLVLAAGAFGLAWALVANPSLVLFALPIVIAALAWTLVNRVAPGPFFTRGNLALAAACLLVPLLLAASDCWLRNLVRSIPVADAPTEVAAVVPPRSAGPANPKRGPIATALRHSGATSIAGVIPPGCDPGAHCPPAAAAFRTEIPVLAVVLAIAGLLFLRRRAAAFGVFALLAAAWLTKVVTFTVIASTPAAGSQLRILLRDYTVSGVRGVTPLLFFLLLAVALALAAELLARVWRPRRPFLVDEGLAAIVAMVALVGLRPHAAALAQRYRAQVLTAPPATLGTIARLDVGFAKQASAMVPAGEKVLLLGYAVEHWERWNFAFGPSRALVLHGDAGFAFVHGMGGFSADEFSQLVCHRFDLPALAARQVKWVFYSDAAFAQSGHACPRAWLETRDQYFEERLRMGDRVLYRLREERLVEAARDPRLGL